MRHAMVITGLALAVAAALPAQSPDAGPAGAPATVEVRGDGHCPVVKAGDTVHFSLTLDGAGAAQAVYADLQMRSAHGGFRESDLPLPGAGAIGGGGAGMRDAQSGKVYHFAFTVPKGSESGVYRGLGVMVTVRDGAGAEPIEAAVERRARDKVRHFCLAVFGPALEGYPTVTDFKGGPIERK
jgi:hypothetical protein